MSALQRAYSINTSAPPVCLRERNCLLPGSTTNIRGYFFSRYPKLIEREIARRRTGESALQALQEVSFQSIQQQKLWETRSIYPNLDALTEDLSGRAGRSILHDLTDAELQDLVSYIRQQFLGKEGQEILEQDRWTIWWAVK